MDINAVMKSLEHQSGVALRVKGYWVARLLLLYMSIILPITQRLPRVLQIPNEEAERRVRWALTYMVVEAYTGNDRWVVVATGWDHLRQAP